MKIVCVGSFCAGAIITDLLNGTKSPFELSVVQNRFNHILKVPLEQNRWLRHTTEWNDDKNQKKQEIPWILLPLHQKEWLDLTTELTGRSWTIGKWFAHHQPVFLIPNLDMFEEVINITTTTMKSKWLRFLRHYYIEINGQKMIQEHALDEVKGMINIIKYDPSWLASTGTNRYGEGPKITNIEFEDVVTGKWCEDIGGDMDHMNTWKNKNPFLHDDYEHDPALVDLWSSHEKHYMDPEPHGESWEALTVERINKTIT